MEETDPVALMKKAKEGDRDAYGKLYELFFTPVYRYVYIRVRDNGVAEDISQVVFLKVYEALSRYEHRDVSPLAYFLTVAKHSLIDYFRKKKDVLGVEEEYDFGSVRSEEKGPLEHSELREDTDKLYKALHLIPSDQRQALSLKYLNSLSNTEISVLMNKTEENIRQLQSRGLRTLRRHLQDLI